MSEVKKVQRWDLDQNLDCILGDDTGRFVSWEDYAALKEQFDFKHNLTEQVVALERQCDALAADRERFAVQCAAAKIAVQYAQSQGFECTLNTPAVDAYANQLRAEGVDFVAEAIGAKCAELKIGSKDWKALKSIVFMLGDFSSKLRAGEPS